MVNRPKAKGTAFETAVKKYLQETLGCNFAVDRLALSGAKDRGDVYIRSINSPDTLMLECKAVRQIGAKQHAAFIDQTAKETTAGGHLAGFLVEKVSGKSVEKSKVSMYLETSLNSEIIAVDCSLEDWAKLAPEFLQLKEEKISAKIAGV